VEEHEAYEAEFATLRAKDFQRFGDFVDWAPPATEGDLDLAEQSELDQLRSQVQALPEKVAEETKPLREKIEALRRSNDQSRSEIRDLKAQIVSLQKQLKHAQKSPAKSAKKAGLETLETAPKANSPPASLKGTTQQCVFVRDKRKDETHGVLVFRVETTEGAWEGRLPAIDARTLATVKPGQTLSLRVAGISPKSVQLALP
jgi:seryl-tRNA synthetase